MSTLESLTRKNKEEVKEQPKRKERPVRTPLSGRRDILTVRGKDPNYVYRWVTKDSDRVDSLQERGYEPVTHSVTVGDRATEQGGQVGSLVTRKAGGGVELVLMRIPKDWYDDDQAAKQREIDSTEAAMKRKAKEAGFYSPKKDDKAFETKVTKDVE